MEFTNNKIIRNFITQQQADEIIEWVEKINQPIRIDIDHHISELIKHINGFSYVLDISNNQLTNQITNLQSPSNIIYQQPPKSVLDIIDAISISLNIPKDNCYLQIIKMNSGGQTKPHYDIAKLGYINFKCNITLKGDDYNFYIEDQKLNISKYDLCSFEASLYKHWTDIFQSERVLLSFGFVLQLSDLNRIENDPRVRLSNRIVKYLQK